MVRTLLVRGMIAGAVAAVLAFVFAWLFGEPALDGGIAYEDALAAAAGEAGGEALVSREVQSTIGLFVGLLVYGLSMGGILGIVYSFAQGRLGKLSARASVVVVALLGFVAVVVMPFIKYPPNPPASSLDETIGLRTGLYVVFLVLSIGFAVGAVALARRLAETRGWWSATLISAGAYIVVMAVVGALLPAIRETPADFPAVVLYDFRLASMGIQVVFWTAMALILATLVDRASRPSAALVS